MNSPLNSSLKLLLLIGVLATFQSNALIAQEGVDGDVVLQVLDAETHRNLDSVVVVFIRQQRKYELNRFGNLSLYGNIVPGDSIKVIRRGYLTRELTIPRFGDLFIKLTPVPVELRNVEIVAYTRESKHFETPQTIARLEAQDFERNAAASIEPTINTIPGVQMESRGPGGSRRLSIRGSLMRSPFGVRDVKVYWNEFPLTLADGSTALELIDPEEIGRLEILKGPQGSIYGEGHGGAALFSTRWAPYGEVSASANVQAGSYGMQKQTLSFSTSSKKTAVSLNYFRYRHDGFREQESVRKDQLNLVTRFRPASNREIKLFFIYYNGAWGLPGELDSLEAATNPRAARSYAVENDTRMERRWLRLGLSNKIHFTENFYNFTAVFLHSTSKLNPYGASPFFNGLKDEGSNGHGLRTIFGYEWDEDDAGLHIRLGGEYQRDLNALAEFDLVNADFGDLRTNDETVSRYFNGFLQATTHLHRKLFVDASLGILQTTFRRTDLVADPEDLSARFAFEPVWLPKLSMSYQFNRRFMLYSLVSRGVSTPTLWEIQASPEVTPERSDHYEIGIRNSLFNNAMLVELNGYATRIGNAIIEQPDSLGFSRFSNNGAIDMRGVELTLRYRIKRSDEYLLSAAYIGLSSGIQRYQYDDMVLNNEDFSGNELPGIPLLQYSAVADLMFYNKLSMHMNFRFFDGVPLNNANSVYSEAYSLLDVRIQYGTRFGEKYHVDFYLGAENLQDTRYNSFFRLNANNGRYFNPQMGRSIYGGIRIAFVKPNRLIN